MAVADTSFLLDLVRGPRSRIGGKARARLRELHAADEPLATTRFNVAELLVGVARSRDPDAERRKIEKLLRPFTILEFHARSAEVFGRVVGHLQATGTPIGDMDALIGAVALETGHSVVTRNVVHFGRITGLEVITY
jgi:tRNA(fMet)-specific endonuclease VapC